MGHDPIPVGEILAPHEQGNGEEGTCSDCGAPGAWHSTPRGRRVFMEPRPMPAQRVPRGLRWRIEPDGTAVLVDLPPLGHCRITHFIVCPSNPAPPGGLLLGLWEKHRDRMAADKGK